MKRADPQLKTLKNSTSNNSKEMFYSCFIVVFLCIILYFANNFRWVPLLIYVGGWLNIVGFDSGMLETGFVDQIWKGIMAAERGYIFQIVANFA